MLKYMVYAEVYSKHLFLLFYLYQIGFQESWNSTDTDFMVLWAPRLNKIRQHESVIEYKIQSTEQKLNTTMLQ